MSMKLLSILILAPLISMAAPLPGEAPENTASLPYRVTFSVDTGNPPSERSSRIANYVFRISGPQSRSYWAPYDADVFYELAERMEQKLNEKQFTIEDADRLMEDLRVVYDEYKPFEKLLETSKSYNKLIGRPFRRDYVVKYQTLEYRPGGVGWYDGPGPYVEHSLSIVAGDKIYMFNTFAADFPVPEMKELAEKLQTALNSGNLDGSDFAWEAKKAFSSIESTMPTVESMVWLKKNYHQKFLKHPAIRAVMDGSYACAPLVAK
jgi:hypothetical protein